MKMNIDFKYAVSYPFYILIVIIFVPFNMHYGIKSSADLFNT